jgi:hypothetical protein
MKFKKTVSSDFILYIPKIEEEQIGFHRHPDPQSGEVAELKSKALVNTVIFE